MSMCGVQSNQVDGMTWYSRVRRKKAKSGGGIRGCLKSVRRIICTTESRKGRGDRVAISVLGRGPQLVAVCAGGALGLLFEPGTGTPWELLLRCACGVALRLG